MKSITFLPLLSLPFFIVSCASKSGSNDYDVSNPYAAPDYSSSDVGVPYQAQASASDVNPAYDAPAVYEDVTVAPSDVAATTPIPATPMPKAPKPLTRKPIATGAKTHTVAPGDSLWKISKKYGVSIDEIKQANGMTKDTAVLGAKLKIPAK